MADTFRVLLSIAEAQAQSSPFRGGDSPHPFAPQDGSNARPFQDIKSMDDLPRDARILFSMLDLNPTWNSTPGACPGRLLAIVTPALTLGLRPVGVRPPPS